MNIKQNVKKNLAKLPIKKKDRIVVALSGGKDSATTAYLMKKFGYNIEGFHINLGLGKYSDRCLDAIEKLCGNLGIKLSVYNIKDEMGASMCYLRSVVQGKNRKEGKSALKNCAICGVVKKWVMNKQARKLKAKYIATGHNLDDEAQTFLINVFKGSPELSAGSGPASKEIKKGFVTRIKPLFYVLENDVRAYSKKMKLPVVYDPCPCALDSYRITVRKFLNTLPEKDKQNLLKNAEKLIGKIKVESGDVSFCESCGEPARSKVCKKCQLLKV
tara:strand:- start:324 stop:1142 length:819 start_codon:yes stop_codon:yes gene_type:complete